jgi:hypothetical protein
MCATQKTGVTRVKNIVVQLEERPWPFAAQNSEEISAFWHEQKREHPHFFDGQVHVMTSWEFRGTTTSAASFNGNMCRTNFASFLYWKMSRAHSLNEVDFSGGAVVLCEDGALLMTLAGDDTIAPKTLEFASGFVDVSDFDQNVLNFDRHVEREALEELAISKQELEGPKKYLVSVGDGVVQAFSIFTINTCGDEFAKRWRHRAGLLKAEISDIIPIYRFAETADFRIQPHVRTVLACLLSPD